jgi:hypothetical protein
MPDFLHRLAFAITCVAHITLVNSHEFHSLSIFPEGTTPDE